MALFTWHASSVIRTVPSGFGVMTAFHLRPKVLVRLAGVPRSRLLLSFCQSLEKRAFLNDMVWVELVTQLVWCWSRHAV